MNARTLLFVFMLSPTLATAQYEFKPILDPSVICNQGIKPRQHILNPLSDKNFENYDIFYITEKMPVPKISADEIEELLSDVIHLNKQEKTKNATIHFQCIVNCRGEAGDYQIIYCPAELADTADQVIKVFRERLQEWNPGMLRENRVDVLVRIIVSVVEGKFKVNAPV